MTAVFDRRVPALPGAVAVILLSAALWLVQVLAPLCPLALADDASQSRLSAEKVDAVIEALESDAERAELIEQLRVLRTVLEEKGTPAPRGIGARAVASLSQRAVKLGDQVVEIARLLGDPRALVSWIRSQVTDPARRAFWVSAITAIALVLGAGLLAQILLRGLLARGRRTLEKRAPRGSIERIRLLVTRLALHLLPPLGFALCAYGALAAWQPDASIRLTASMLINAVVLSRIVLALMRLVLAPLAPGLRLLRIADDSAAYAFVWVARFVDVAVFSYFAVELSTLLGASPAGRSALVNIVALVIAAMAIVLTLQVRGAGARMIIRTIGERRGALRLSLHRLAEIWHVLAILYIAGAYFTWLLGIEGGFRFLVRGTLVTVVAVVVARFADRLAVRGVERLFRIGDELRRRFPELEDRARRYQPVLRMVLGGLIAVVAFVVVLEGWGISVTEIFAEPGGRELLARLSRITVILALATLAWEATRFGIRRYLGQSVPGAPAVRSQRLQTLLPLAQSAVLILIASVAVMSVLSEIGINIGPLLAGAGIVGLAIGFGAQTLVKDVINGAFILMENAIRVGDVVEVAGHAGIVEAISVRSVRHRDLSGTVHTIPFSSVSVVKNYTKDFSYYLMDVGVAYRENTDEVVSVLRKLLDEMREDPDFGPVILEPLEVLGVNGFADSAVIIRARIKTRPLEQWRVGREFNRRMKQRFDQLDIEIPFPHRTLYFGVDKDGTAAPARLHVEDSMPPKPPAEKAGDGQSGPTE